MCSAYNTGSCRIRSGSAAVKGYGTNFTVYTSVGDLFRLEDDTTFYEVAAISNASNLTLSSRYSNTNYQTSRSSESIASANTATRIYSGTLDYTPVIQSSVTINASIESFTDDGAGVLTGDGTPVGSGTISYDDGSWAITLGTDLTATINVIASYLSGDTLNGMTYQIVTDYTPNIRLPEMAESDVGFPKIYTKAVRLIDSAIYNASINSIHVTNASITNASINTLKLSGLTASKPVFTDANKLVTSSGTLAVNQGGTGAATLADGGLVVGNVTGAVEVVAAGLTTEILVGGGALTKPVWTTVTGTGAPVKATSPTLVTPLLGTPTSGDLQNCTAATTTTKGVVELDTVTETVAGTDTSRATTAEGVHAAIAVDKNPLAFAQGINMTAAASGSNGIQVGDDDDIDFGTGNFFLCWEGSLPDWTYNTSFFTKFQGNDDRYIFDIYTQKLRMYLVKTGGITINKSTTTNFIPINGTVMDIVGVVIRETASTAGSVSFYANGVLIETIVISAGTPADLSNTGILSLLSTGVDDRQAGTIYHVYAGNFAPTAAEVLDMYRNGIPESWKWGSQTSLNVSTMANYGPYPYETFDGASATGFHAINTTGYGVGGTAAEMVIQQGKNYEYGYDLSLASGSLPEWINVGATISSSDDLFGGQSIPAEGHNIKRFTALTLGTCSTYFRHADGVAGEYTISNFYFKEIGATLALEGEGIQPAPGQWLDASSNKLHAMQPATGSSLVRSKRDFTVKWTNTWAGTHEAQYISGINESVLPPNCYITSIIGVVAGGTIEDIIVGDGSDTDHWVAITTGLAAGTVAFTVANPISDGVNYKLVVDPDANFTGSIAWTISGIVL